MLLSYSRHWGTYDNPLNEIKKQFNSLFEVTYAPQPVSYTHLKLKSFSTREHFILNALAPSLKLDYEAEELPISRCV